MRIKQIIRRLLNLQEQIYVQITVAQIKHGHTLAGKRIIITGGSRGLGLAMAKNSLQKEPPYLSLDVIKLI